MEDSYPLGPSKMFFKLTLETPLIQDMGYGGMFWMEPDCWPIRNGWLERFIKEGTASGPYWMVEVPLNETGRNMRNSLRTLQITLMEMLCIKSGIQTLFDTSSLSVMTLTRGCPSIYVPSMSHYMYIGCFYHTHKEADSSIISDILPRS